MFVKFENFWKPLKIFEKSSEMTGTFEKVGFFVILVLATQFFPFYPIVDNGSKIEFPEG